MYVCIYYLLMLFSLYRRFDSIRSFRYCRSRYGHVFLSFFFCSIFLYRNSDYRFLFLSYSNCALKKFSRIEKATIINHHHRHHHHHHTVAATSRCTVLRKLRTCYVLVCFTSTTLALRIMHHELMHQEKGRYTRIEKTISLNPLD
jgi:hypothetical protein